MQARAAGATVKVILEGAGNVKNVTPPKLEAPAALKVYDPTTSDKVVPNKWRIQGRRVQDPAPASRKEAYKQLRERQRAERAMYGARLEWVEGLPVAQIAHALGNLKALQGAGGGNAA